MVFWEGRTKSFLALDKSSMLLLGSSQSIANELHTLLLSSCYGGVVLKGNGKEAPVDRLVDLEDEGRDENEIEERKREGETQIFVLSCQVMALSMS